MLNNKIEFHGKILSMRAISLEIGISRETLQKYYDKIIIVNLNIFSSLFKCLFIDIIFRNCFISKNKNINDKKNKETLISYI